MCGCAKARCARTSPGAKRAAVVEYDRWPGALAQDALVVVDVQNDFLPGGALGVPRGGEVIGPLNTCLRAFAAAGRPVFATRDWHPQNHCSFKARGGPWPAHCVAGTPGADFAAALDLPAGAVIVFKGSAPEHDAYSGFAGTDLGARLAAAGVRRVVIGGLATDYCVLNTVLDARAAGFEVVVLEDAVRAVDVAPGDGERALERMRDAGARLVRSA